jgi:Flp pilus assembly protein TadG
VSGDFDADTSVMTTALPHCNLSPSFRRRLRCESGQSLVEFAVVLPVFILLVLGILYFSRYENYANQETQLAEQGVRWAAINVNPGSSSVPTQTLQQYIQAQASPELSSGSGDVTTPLKAYIYYSPTGQTTTVRVCVTATVRFPTPIGVPSTVIAESASMHVEQTRTNWTADASPASQCPTT